MPHSNSFLEPPSIVQSDCTYCDTADSKSSELSAL
jgi:hypothetical protein